MEGFRVVGKIPGVGIPPPFVHNCRIPQATLDILLKEWDGGWLDLGGGVKTISAEEVYNRGIKGLSSLVKRRHAKIIMESVTEILKHRPYGLPESFPLRGHEDGKQAGRSKRKTASKKRTVRNRDKGKRSRKQAKRVRKRTRQ